MRLAVTLSVVGVTGWTALGASSAQAAVGGEQIGGYAVDLVLRPDGSMHVQETIEYDFGSVRRHGIQRLIPVEFRYDANHYREHPIDHVSVRSPTGAPAQVAVSGHSVIDLRVGDPNNDTVTGRQTYVIGYDLHGVVNSFADHQELYWNPIGDEWPVPIATPSVKVTGPAAVLKVACFEGRAGSTATCPGTIGADGTAAFTGSALPPDQGMTVVATFPVGTFPHAAPILKQRWTWGRAFSLTPVTGGASLGLVLLLGGWAVLAVLRKGRDERYYGLTPGLRPGLGQVATVGRVPWFRRDPVAVQFAPPDGVRPGQLGTLITERARTLDVTATIIDLAVRGFLRIEEAGAKNWRLVKLEPPRGRAGRLHLYESRLYDEIFRRRRQEVLLSSLKRTFGRELVQVKARLEADITELGWFRALPSSVRTRWAWYGGLIIAVGVVLTWLLAALSIFGLLGVAVIVAGLIVLALSPRMPARTAQGTAMLAQVRGFQLYLEKAEARQIRFEEAEDIFSRYLPFAIAFGLAERWAGVFAQLAARGTSPSWYTGSSLSTMTFDFGQFSESMNHFTTTADGALSTQSYSSTSTGSSTGSSGFGEGGYSGGGDGGGGGGSW